MVVLKVEKSYSTLNAEVSILKVGVQFIELGVFKFNLDNQHPSHC